MAYEAGAQELKISRIHSYRPAREDELSFSSSCITEADLATRGIVRLALGRRGREILQMTYEHTSAGRPRASSRNTIEEAAAELFLEQSYAGTTVDDIAQRAGVSRATFFNYFASKGDLLWIDADHAIECFEKRLSAGGTVMEAVIVVAAGIGSERVPLAVTQSDVMGTGEELVASGLARVARVAGLIRASLAASGGRGEGAGLRGLELSVRANALAGAIVAAWGAWILGGIDRAPLSEYLNEALALVQLEQ